MSTFLHWEGWTAVNGICQILISLFAFIAICITVCQIGNRRRVSIDIKSSLKIVRRNETETTVGIVFEIFNYGLSPIFMKTCWLGFRKNTIAYSDSALMCPMQKEFIHPGECKEFGAAIQSDVIRVIEQKVRYHDTLYVFVESGIGKVKRFKANMDYSEFKFEFERLEKIKEKTTS